MNEMLLPGTAVPKFWSLYHEPGSFSSVELGKDGFLYHHCCTLGWNCPEPGHTP